MSVARVLGTFGVHGHLKCAYATDHPELLAQRKRYLLFDPSSYECLVVTPVDVELRQRNFIVRFAGFDAPEPLKRYSGWELAYISHRGELPREEDEVYLFELEGMEVRLPSGEVLGHVSGVLETAAHVLLEVAEIPGRMIPYTRQYVPDINLDEGWLITTYPLYEGGGSQ